MTEAQKVVEIKPVEKPSAPIPKKTAKIRMEAVTPTHIIEVWRFFDASLKMGNQPYPDTTEDSREALQSHLFVYLQNPAFMGLLAKVGKRPVGMILGNVVHRAYGRPRKFFYIWSTWVDPAFRKQGVGQALFHAYVDNMKKQNVFHWESHMSEALAKELLREVGIPIRPLCRVVGGRV